MTVMIMTLILDYLRRLGISLRSWISRCEWTSISCTLSIIQTEEPLIYFTWDRTERWMSIISILIWWIILVSIYEDGTLLEGVYRRVGLRIFTLVQHKSASCIRFFYFLGSEGLKAFCKLGNELPEADEGEDELNSCFVHSGKLSSTKFEWTNLPVEKQDGFD